MSIVKNLKDNAVILFFGDSITDCGRWLSMDGNHILGSGYSYICSSALAINYCEKQFKFINKGISGNVIEQLYERLNKDVIDNAPDLVSILVGINDILHAFRENSGSHVEHFIATYRKIIDAIKSELPESTLVICEPFYLAIDNYDAPYRHTPYCLCEEYVEPMNIPKNDMEIAFCQEEILKMQKALRRFAEEENILFIPLQEEFDRYANEYPGEYFIWDSIHPTVAGHQLIARKWLSLTD